MNCKKLFLNVVIIYFAGMSTIKLCNIICNIKTYHHYTYIYRKVGKVFWNKIKLVELIRSENYFQFLQSFISSNLQTKGDKSMLSKKSIRFFSPAFSSLAETGLDLTLVVVVLMTGFLRPPFAFWRRWLVVVMFVAQTQPEEQASSLLHSFLLLEPGGNPGVVGDVSPAPAGSLRDARCLMPPHGCTGTYSETWPRQSCWLPPPSSPAKPGTFLRENILFVSVYETVKQVEY